ncbi:hypothetical protein SAMN04489732_118101 [Amycolatopsis saalfeldensis]|uniref:Uncharacterized protein n=1 Tax=Amycolatopsis saalfeldensis TaxID=394193 RepID=A0A1H8YIM5_9PSEU|nr:hypothetical protein SAMN04489732_118101 [Amycolatopsis saalfeldensis]
MPFCRGIPTSDRGWNLQQERSALYWLVTESPAIVEAASQLSSYEVDEPLQPRPVWSNKINMSGEMRTQRRQSFSS